MTMFGKGWATRVNHPAWAFVATAAHALHRCTRYKSDLLSRAHWHAFHQAIAP